MTIATAIEKAKQLRSGQVGSGQKLTDANLIDYLSQLDQQTDIEIVRTHANAPAEEFVPYVSSGEGATPTTTELLVPAPYDKLYVPFLLSKIDWAYGEFAKYNNSEPLFEAQYNEFTAQYNRANTPISSDSPTVGAPLVTNTAFDPLA